MKSLHYIALLLFVLAGCGSEDKLLFEPLSFEQHTCADCALFSISVPEAQGESGLAMAINRAVREEIIALVLFEEAVAANTISDAMQSFEQSFIEMQQRYAEEDTPWEVNIKGVVSYEDKTHLTIGIDAFIFTGGAHGYTSQKFLNFDKLKGKEVEAWELFEDQDEFQRFAERKFREKEAIPADKSINHTGLMFEKDLFYLPENIGFTDKGIQLLYNPYEVASYADGPIVLTLPYREVRPYLAQRPKS